MLFFKDQESIVTKKQLEIEPIRFIFPYQTYLASQQLDLCCLCNNIPTGVDGESHGETGHDGDSDS